MEKKEKSMVELIIANQCIGMNDEKRAVLLYPASSGLSAQLKIVLISTNTWKGKVEKLSFVKLQYHKNLKFFIWKHITLSKYSIL